MLEGGNEQMGSFFDRHGMGNSSEKVAKNNSFTSGLDRYKTKAASFYRQHLISHAKNVAKKGGLYEGREASRKRCSKNNTKGSRKSSKGKNKTSVGQQQPKLPTVTEKECVVGA